MAILRRMGNLFRRTVLDREAAAEMEAHIAMRTDQNVARGMKPDEARRDALVRFGNRTATREHVAAADATLSLESVARDVRFALRQARRSPGFLVTAVLTLAVAICANAVVFSMLNALVLRTLDLPGAKRLYTIEQRGLPMNSYPDYRDLRERNRVFENIALYNFAPVGLDTGGGNAQQAWIYETSGNYFDVLGVQPYLGRFFHAADEHGTDAVPYIVLSYAYWRNRFHSDAGIVGRSVEMNRHAFTILGVAPPQFRGTELIFSPDFWAPIVDQAVIEGTNSLEDRSERGLYLIGRLKPQVTVAQAGDDVNRVAATLTGMYPTTDDGLKFSLARPGLVGDMLGGPVRAFVGGLALLAGLILLAACANLGSLFASRAADRSREIALRVALGSTHRRILRQLFTEALIVSLAGGVAGIVGSVFLLRALRAWQPVPRFPIALPVHPDAATYIVSLLLALASGLLFGLAPIKQIFGTAPWEVVKTGGKTTGSARRFSLRDVLLVVQVAVCAVLMTSSLVALRGLARSLHSNFGFEAQNAVLVSTDLNMAGYKGDRIPAMERRILDAAAAIPGVTAAGTIDNIPLGVGWSESGVYRDGSSDFRESREVAETMQYSVSPEYFKAAGTTLLAGRNLTWHDDRKTPLVAVVNATFARAVFGSVAQAIGRHFLQDAKTRYEVVGVVEDGKYITLTEDPRPAFFAPFAQSPTPPSGLWLVVRSSAEPQRIAATLHDALRSLDSELPLTILTWDEQLDSALFAARAATLSLGVLGALGAMLAMTGIFGLASYSVGKRLREMGIRMALGAGNGQVLGAALGRAFRLLAVGSVAGLALGVAATRLLSYIVYQASPRDPFVLAGSVVAMMLLGLAATWTPAQRALRVDPSKLMREE
jgi:predicted permease